MAKTETYQLPHHFSKTPFFSSEKILPSTPWRDLCPGTREVAGGHQGFQRQHLGRIDLISARDRVLIQELQGHMTFPHGCLLGQKKPWGKWKKNTRIMNIMDVFIMDTVYYIILYYIVYYNYIICYI